MSPCCQLSGAQTALEALIRWANFMSSSDDTGFRFARAMHCSFCLAWNIAVACQNDIVILQSQT